MTTSDAKERGATLVEYALVVALLCVGIIASIQRFQDGAEERFDDRGVQGSPSEEFGNLGPDGGGGGNPSTEPAPTPTAVTTLTVQPLSALATASDKDWSMTVTVRVFGDGEPLGGVVFTSPVWNPAGGDTRSCTTTSSGVCTYTQSGMVRNGSSPPPATFTIGTASYTNPGVEGTTLTVGGGATTTCDAPTKGSGTFSC